MSKLEKNIGVVMRISVTIAMLFLLAGMVIIVVKLCTHTDIYYPQVLQINFMDTWNGIMSFDQWAYLLIGLFLLILTPVLRVVTSIFSFIAQKDIKYVFITIIVLSIIIITFIMSAVIK